MNKTIRLIGRNLIPVSCIVGLIFISNSISEEIFKSIFTLVWQIGITIEIPLIYFQLVQDGYIKDYIFNAIRAINSVEGISLNEQQKNCKHEFTLYHCHRCGQHHCSLCDISQHLDCTQYLAYKK
jgi:hypothetical protein